MSQPVARPWGKLGRDYIYLLAGLERYEELDAFVDIAPDNLLHNLQSDILELRNAAVAGQSAEASPTVATNVRWRWMTAV
ncbi:exodeoxyribonuclease V subunit gamma [Klebsiella pneumoniae]|uniref:Exodeoxyribonuclease V subunit gamma n=1 Tax=Klebsiella pneumoniae TaxID=573 RepID=A0A4P0YG68_KLEPN|nr:exodeoxyribonuclease V subunit gamma [Klebsiella pneumoniae]